MTRQSLARAVLWTVTHAGDFARPFARLLGNGAAIGEDFHITSDRSWAWNEIFAAIAAALGVADPAWTHVPSHTLARYNPAWGGPPLGDKTYSVRFDNTKVKAVAGDFDCPVDPWEGMRRVAAANPPRPDDFDPATDALFDRIAAERAGLGR